MPFRKHYTDLKRRKEDGSGCRYEMYRSGDVGCLQKRLF